jgi:branched-chain amino acid transport system substrate-binding protein
MGSFSDDLQAKAIIDYSINELRARRIGIVSDTSEYGQGGSGGMIGRLAEYGLKPVAHEKISVGDTDFTTQILRLKDQNPEIVNTYIYPKELAILLRQAKELRLNTQFITSAAATSATVLEQAGDAAIGVLMVYPCPYLVDSSEPVITNFVRDLKANFHVPPGRPWYADMEGIAVPWLWLRVEERGEGFDLEQVHRGFRVLRGSELILYSQ